MGIEYEVGNQWEFLNYHKSIFVNDRSIFFVGTKAITEVSRITGKAQTLDIDLSENIAFDGNFFYYTDNYWVLTKYDTQNGEKVSLSEVIAYDFCLDEQSIYYVSITDGYHVYQCSPNGENRHKVSDIAAQDISCDETHIYITPRGGDEQVILLK